MFITLLSALGLDNGVGLTPQMGYSSWNDCGSYVTEEHIVATAEYMQRSGLQALGYDYVNVDEGWLLGRSQTPPHVMVEDRTLFPSGMKGLGERIHRLGFKYGLYTSRGVQQCDTAEYQKRCFHGGVNPPAPRCSGSHGFEEWVAAGWARRPTG